MAGLVSSCTMAANAAISLSLPIWGPFVPDGNFLKRRFAAESQDFFSASVYTGVTSFGGSLLASTVKGPALGL